MLSQAEHKQAISSIVCKLLQNERSLNNFSLELLSGGANNRIYHISSHNNNFILKHYFVHSQNNHDRCSAEYFFSSFLWNCGIRCIPQPIATDNKMSASLFEFVPGTKVSKATLDFVLQAISFFKEINHHKTNLMARQLPDAAEACYSLNEHLQCISGRVERLLRISKKTAVDLLAADFIKTRLIPAWNRVKINVLDGAQKINIDPAQQIPIDEKCLSPSDFGFHNTIQQYNRTLTFLDFEYSGWDDVAKMVCDFFCQPKIPAPLSHFNLFAQQAFTGLANPEVHLHRTALLLPAYQIKWCCIILNEFLPVGGARRAFANGDDKERKSNQLKKAQKYFNSFYMRESLNGIH